MNTRWSTPIVIGSLIGLAGSMGACSSPTPEPSPSSSQFLRLVTIDAPQNTGMDAGFSGTLTVGGDGCVRAHPGGDESVLYTIVWPQGYTVQGDSKSFQVVNADKKVVARSGSWFEIGGGLGLPDSPRDDWTERDCVNGHLWIVAPPDVSSVK